MSDIFWGFFFGLSYRLPYLLPWARLMVLYGHESPDRFGLTVFRGHLIGLPTFGV